MKKFLMLLLAAAMLLSLAACAENNTVTTTESTQPGETTSQSGGVENDMSRIFYMERQLAENLGSSYTVNQQISDEDLRSVYGIDTSLASAWVARKSQGAKGSLADIVIMLDAKDGQVDTLVGQLNACLAKLVNEARGSDKLTEKILGARLYAQDSYVALIITGQSYFGSDSAEEKTFTQAEYAKVEVVVKELFSALPKNLAVIPEA